jgi:glycosyltransferase involved in cell wall biosynthesis
MTFASRAGIPYHVAPSMAIKLGILANEFFDLTLGRMGGFGWAARQVARCFQDPAHGVEVVFLTGELRAANHSDEMWVHDTRLVLRHQSVLGTLKRTRDERPDLLLVMDYRPNYRPVVWALPRTPMIVWVRDPRPPDDVAKVDTLRLPGSDDVKPAGTFQPDCRSLGTIARAARWLGRPVTFASPATYLRNKLERMIGLPVDDFAFLPNPVDLDPGHVQKSARPLVVFLARLDPYKRPWLFVELARRFPEVEFVLAGRAHFHGAGSWKPDSLPPNARVVGHVDGPEKLRLLASAWVLVNTSIHEGLAVSLLEGLACEAPLLACVDPEQVVSRFGIHVGRFDGAGLEALPALEAGLRRLLTETELRTRLGRTGRQWVNATHNRDRFLQAFRQLCVRSGVG